MDSNPFESPRSESGRPTARPIVMQTSAGLLIVLGAAFFFWLLLF